MALNISEKRLSKFKQELPSIIFLSVYQLWLSFYFPPFIRVGSPWSTIMTVITSIIGISCIIYLFSCADQWAHAVDRVAAPYKYRWLKIETIICAVVAHIAMVVMWYNDIYHMSNIHYALFYANGVVLFVLLQRAMYR